MTNAVVIKPTVLLLRQDDPLLRVLGDYYNALAYPDWSPVRINSSRTVCALLQKIHDETARARHAHTRLFFLSATVDCRW